MQFVIALQLTLLFNFLGGQRDLVLGGTSQGSPLLNRTLYTIM